MLVGGEESNNEKIKQRKQERKIHADKKRNELKQLVEDDVSLFCLCSIITKMSIWICRKMITFCWDHNGMN